MSLKIIYEKYVKMDKSIQKEYNTKMNRIVEEMVKGIRQHSRILNMFYDKVYYSGSHWDGLQVGTRRQEGDVNVCLDIEKWMPISMKFMKDDACPGKSNFVYICVDNPGYDESFEILKQILTWDSEIGWIISPLRLFKEFINAGNEFLEKSNNYLEVDIATEGRTYLFRTTSHIGAPWSITFHHRDYRDIIIDFVPAIRLRSIMMPRGFECRERIRFIQSRYGTVTDETECLAICLHKADPRRFQLDFHELERKVLAETCFVKMVIRLMKYLRNVWMEPLNILPSHLIKTVVMEKVLSEDQDYWERNWNLEHTFTVCFAKLVESVENGCVKDVFFPSVNLMEMKIKNERTKAYLQESMTNLLKVFINKGNEMAFSGQACLLCDPYSKLDKSARRHMLEYHGWSEHTSYEVATSCTDENEMLDKLEEIKFVPPRERKYTYSDKEVICPHCTELLRSKHDLLGHIYLEHERFRPIAAMALKDTGHKLP